MRPFSGKIVRKAGEVLSLARRQIYQTPQEKRAACWFKVEGDRTLRLNYDLDENSLVFDLGGYEGQWTSDIFAMYLCTIHVFEPVPEFAKRIQRRFLRNQKVLVHGFGLSNETKRVKIAIAGDVSSIYKQGKDHAEVALVRAVDFIRENHIDRIDLMKINIEGGEYDLLEHLIGTGFVKNIGNIQVQFHDFIPDAERRMRAIQKSLANTHSLTYQHLFVWENWRLNI